MLLLMGNSSLKGCAGPSQLAEHMQISLSRDLEEALLEGSGWDCKTRVECLISLFNQQSCT